LKPTKGARKSVVKAALFDLDGTLIDSDEAVVWCVNELLRKLNLPAAEPDDIIGLIGVGLLPLLKEFMPDPEAHVAEYRRLYRRGFGERTKVYDGAADLLSGLREAGVRTAIVTNRNSGLAEAIMAHFGLDVMVDTIIGEGDGLPLKPDSAIIDEACRRLGVTAKETLMVGDTDIDVLTGLNAGCDTVLVVHKDSLFGKTAGSKPGHVVTSLPEILNLI
jgi:HAD superfamily hydrolase (TIGR01509 family)